MANTDYTQIKIKSIPSIFPVAAFEDLKVTYNRIIRQPDAYKETTYTAKSHRTIDKDKSRQILVQSVFRNKYIIEIEIKEQSNFDLIRIAGDCKFQLYDSTLLDAYILNIDYEKVEDTWNWIATIEFYVLCEDYKQVNNYLEKTHLREQFSDLELNRLFIWNHKDIDNSFATLDNQYIFYSSLVPKNSQSEINEQIDDSTGVALVNNSIDFDIINLKLYLNDTDRKIAQRYLTRCDLVAYNPSVSTDTARCMNVDILTFTTDYSDAIVGRWVYVNGVWNQLTSKIYTAAFTVKYSFANLFSDEIYLFTDDNAQERIIPEVPENNLIDLFEVNLAYKYNKIDYTGY